MLQTERGVSAVKLIVMGDNNEGAIGGGGFASLIEQFDRDPDNGADLADGAPLEVTDKIVCARLRQPAVLADGNEVGARRRCTEESSGHAFAWRRAARWVREMFATTG